MPLTAQAAARSRGLTLLALFLIASPLVQWAYVSTLSHFTILEPPYTALRGLPLALHVFFSTWAILPVLGVALFYRARVRQEFRPLAESRIMLQAVSPVSAAPQSRAGSFG